ncbi:MAG: hypothetical protein CMK09_17930 [Ponticaulis sp.]|nr:hypothetical protein [Ponticaulis sp.]|tara:strand:+ start:10448 stop:11734 length:1287 start_codon:yes stop_codon:yes gene_type:complete
MLMSILKWLFLALLAAISLMVVGCSTVGLPHVSYRPVETSASPDLLAAIDGYSEVTTAEQWTTERAPYWLNVLKNNIYGTIPEPITAETLSRDVIATDLFEGAASLIEVQLKLTIHDRDYVQDVHFVVPNTKGPHPVILGAGSCPNDVTLPFAGIEPRPDIAFPGYCGMNGGWQKSLAHFVFGRYIETPPLEEIIAAGFAFGAYYPGMIVPDSREAGLAALSEINSDLTDEPPAAAIGIWAWVTNRIVDHIENDPALDAQRIITFGHSRTAKSALLAGAIDARIAGVISHQSGTGGAALQKNDIGESIEQITGSYPHWFTPAYASYAEKQASLPVDQHALIALMAPRALLLGNSARDQWADPQGSFAAARAASPVYKLLGAPGFDAVNLKDFQPDAPLAFQFREGTHGITPEDWGPFLEWLTAQFGEK